MEGFDFQYVWRRIEAVTVPKNNSSSFEETAADSRRGIGDPS